MREYTFELTFLRSVELENERVKVVGVESLQEAFNKAVDLAGKRELRKVTLVDIY